MKNIKILSTILLLAVIFSTACRKKLTDRSILSGSEIVPVLTLSKSDTIKLMMDSSDKKAIEMKWTSAEWGFPTTTQYAVEIMKKGGNWSDASVLSAGKEVMASLTQTELNDIAIKQGIVASETGILWSRIKASISNSSAAIYSQPKEIIVSTFAPMKPLITAVPVADSIILLKDSATVNAMSVTWNQVNWNIPSTSVYELQMKMKGESWDNPMIMPTGTATNYSINHKSLNVLLLGTYGVDTLGTESFVYRVKASQPGTSRVSYSDEVTKAFTTYQMVFETKKMYLPGDYQGWNPGSATVQVLEEVTPGSGNFSGLVEKTKADGSLSNTEFKMTPEPDWDYDFGDNGSDYSNLSVGSGVIGPKYLGTNGPNFKLVDGTYLITVDTTSSVRTWTYSLENWGLIGDATNQADTNGNSTPDGWENDKNMRYNQATKMYEITIDLLVGGIKFRKNDAWAVDYGDNGNNLSMELGGANIPVSVAGNYTIKMDLEGKVYTITKN
jgi:starch-binding outer membrane protein SusE/F